MDFANKTTHRFCGGTELTSIDFREADGSAFQSVRLSVRNANESVRLRDIKLTIESNDVSQNLPFDPIHPCFLFQKYDVVLKCY